MIRIPDTVVDVRVGPQSSTWTPAAYAQHCHYKILALTRYLQGQGREQVLALLRERAEAGIHLWAADSMAVIGGGQAAIDEYFAKAQGADLRSERFRRVVVRAQPRVSPTEVVWGTALFECGVDYLEREEFEAAAVYFELLTASGWQIPDLPRLLAQTRATLKQIHLTHAHDVIEQKTDVIKHLEAELAHRDTLLAQAQPEIDRRDRLLRELAIECQAEVDRRDEMLQELEDESRRQIDLRDALLAQSQPEIDRRDEMLRQLEEESRMQIELRDALLARSQPEIERRDQMLADLQAERIEAVRVRDQIIREQQLDMDWATRGWRRWIVARRR